jgi:peptide/nickel transport system substrate-binding protein
VSDFKPGDVVVYDINPYYRDPNKPFFKQVQLKGGGDATSAARAVFQTGEVDYAANLQVESAVLNQLIEGGKGNLITATSPNVEYLLLNRADPNKNVNGARSEPTTSNPFLGDLKVRQALALAIDRKQIADLLYGSLGEATCNMVPAPSMYASPNTKCDRDLVQAGALLDQAGWIKGTNGIRSKDGVKMALLFQTTVDSVKQKEQDLIKADWQALGIQVELKATPGNVFWSADVASPDTGAKFYADIEMFTNGSGSPDPSTYFGAWTCDQIAQKSNNWSGANWERFCNPAYDQLYQQLKSEADPAKRTDLIIKLNDFLVNDVVDIPLVARKFPVSGVAKDLKGVLPTPWDSDLWNIADWTR